MTKQTILQRIGNFSDADLDFFDHCTTFEHYQKNDVLLKEGEICQAFYFITSGSFFQFRSSETDDIMIDLHLEHEWMYNQQSLVEQKPSNTTITAFTRAEVLKLTLQNFHYLVSKSSSFLQFGRIMNQDKDRTGIYDSSMTPAERYKYISLAKPRLIEVFPVKMIASFLKIAPETLSRVRGRA